MLVWLAIAVLTAALCYVAYALDRVMRQQTAWNRHYAESQQWLTVQYADLRHEVTILNGALPTRDHCDGRCPPPPHANRCRVAVDPFDPQKAGHPEYMEPIAGGHG